VRLLRPAPNTRLLTPPSGSAGYAVLRAVGEVVTGNQTMKTLVHACTGCARRGGRQPAPCVIYDNLRTLGYHAVRVTFENCICCSAAPINPLELGGAGNFMMR
jgi:hypothetical protein